jgi:hypothetical protein
MERWPFYVVGIKSAFLVTNAQHRVVSCALFVTGLDRQAAHGVFRPCEMCAGYGRAGSGIWSQSPFYCDRRLSKHYEQSVIQDFGFKIGRWWIQSSQEVGPVYPSR